MQQLLDPQPEVVVRVVTGLLDVVSQHPLLTLHQHLVHFTPPNITLASHNQPLQSGAGDPILLGT